MIDAGSGVVDGGVVDPVVEVEVEVVVVVEVDFEPVVEVEVEVEVVTAGVDVVVLDGGES
jgi:hypothetical protein